MKRLYNTALWKMQRITLRCASFEGEQIALLYNIPKEKRLIGSSQATCMNYRQLAQQVLVLHCCHHAQSRLDNPLESQLKLGDGSITLGQLMTPGWRLPTLQICGLYILIYNLSRFEVECKIASKRDKR